MKLFHISDLHLGKRIYEFSMLEEQRELLLEILRSIDEEQPQALLISGDIYDKPVPPTCSRSWLGRSRTARRPSAT